jgi:hypothetical protein
MLTIKSMKQMRTSRNVRSFHARLHAAGVSATDHDKARLSEEERALRLRAAGPLRVLPPSAREQQASAW